MEKDKKLQIYAVFVLITIALVSIGITANETINETRYEENKENNYCQHGDDCNQAYCNNNQQCQGNYYCNNKDNCYTNNCNYNQQQNRNCQPQSGCGWRN